MKTSIRLLLFALYATLFLNIAHAHYNPRVGSFISRDPLGEAGGFNLYAYCGNDPVNKHDPLGLSDIRRQGSRGVIMMPEGPFGGDNLGLAYALGTINAGTVSFAPWTGLLPTNVS